MAKIIPPKEVSAGWTPEQQASLNSNGSIKKVDGVRTIDASGMSKEEYVKKAVAARDDDLLKLKKLLKKRDDVREKRFNMFGFIGYALANEELTEREKDLDIKIANVMRDIQFNQEAIMNTEPSPPPMPPELMPPTPPCQMYVNTGAQLRCLMSLVPTEFIADPSRRVILEGAQMGNVMDNKVSNLRPGMMCQSLANPAVASATAAAMGALVPQPCSMVALGPWMTGKMNVLVEGKPALMNTDTLMCSFGGQLSFVPTPPSVPAGGFGSSLQTAGELLGWQAVENLITLKSGSQGAGGGAVVVLQGVLDIVTGKTENNPQSWKEAEDRIRQNNKKLDELMSGDAEQIMYNAPEILRTGTDTAASTFEGAFNEHRNNAKKAINEHYDEVEREILNSDSGPFMKELRMQKAILDRSMALSEADLIGYFGDIGGTFIKGVGGALSGGLELGYATKDAVSEVIDYKFNKSLMDDDSDIFGSKENAELYADLPEDIKNNDKGNSW